MEQDNTQLQTRIQELEAKVKTLDRQVRARNTTLAAVLTANGGTVRVPDTTYKMVTEDFAGATFRTEHNTTNGEYVVTGVLVPKTATVAV